MTVTLQGKVALVTGGSRGIGAAIAERLARDGASVALTYAASPERAEAIAGSITKAGGQALAIQADSADPQAIERAVAETVRQFGGIDILVNNAGIAPFKPADAFTVEEFDRLVAINIRAVFIGARAAAQHMRENGRIVTIGSVNADRVPVGAGALYGMTKSALIALTKGLAREYGPRGITVNLVQPGPIDTELNPAEGPFAPMLLPFLAIPRYGTSQEVAALTAFLAGPEAGYVTAAVINIDGGFTA